MATYQKFNQFVEDLATGVHDLSTDTLKFYLTNATPDAAADAVKADLAEIAGGNGYTAGGVTPAITSAEQTGGTFKLVLADPAVITASSGSIGPFRYVVLYNDTPTSPADPLILYYDYGSEITLAEDESLNLNFDAAGIATKTVAA